MKAPSRIGVIHICLVAFLVAILVKTARVQFWQGAQLAKSALHQQSTSSEIPAARGDIVDARGELLAQSREKVKLDIAPQEVKDTRRLRSALLHAKVPADWIARATDQSRKWVSLPGRYVSLDVAGLMAMRGVYSTPMVERAYAFSPGTRRIVGSVDANGKAVDGIELSLDSLLRGQAGRAIVMHDVRGARFESPDAPSKPPVMGNTIVLTINQELQEIAERALANAVSEHGAEGGDVVVLDAHNGEILALASQRANPASTSSTALMEPYEPGSTLKPFIAASLLERGRAQESTMVNTFGGQLTINGRTIYDEHKGVDAYSLADVIRYSSNVGIVQLAERLSPREQYETLRDFGFGSPTGVAYPVESGGTLHEPARWSKQSANSLAMGYEIAVTPLQLAAAYVALANDGELLEPALVKEVRSPDGTVLYKHDRRVVRRVISAATAQRIRKILLTVVEGGGTAKRADLETFSLAGKTGTARRTVHGSYALQQHIPTFVGLFPGDKPQIVILVKIDNPQGEYMGGKIAAPVTKAVLEAAIASTNASLNRHDLALSQKEHVIDTANATLRLALAQSPETTFKPLLPHEDESALHTPTIVRLPMIAQAPVPKPPPRVVPDVHGMTVRDAAYALHTAGFRVVLQAGVQTTLPAAGSMEEAGTVVHLSPTP